MSPTFAISLIGTQSDTMSNIGIYRFYNLEGYFSILKKALELVAQEPFVIFILGAKESQLSIFCNHCFLV